MGFGFPSYWRGFGETESNASIEINFLEDAFYISGRSNELSETCYEYYWRVETTPKQVDNID